jgi:predicted phage gp36 major capsid-like protein
VTRMATPTRGDEGPGTYVLPPEQRSGAAGVRQILSELRGKPQREKVSATLLREARQREQLLVSAAHSLSRAEPTVRSHRAEALDTPEYRGAFATYIRHGARALDERARNALAYGEVRDLSSLTGSAGGYSVPQAFRDALTQSLKWATAMRAVATVASTPDGRTLNWPGVDDTGNAATQISENTQVTIAGGGGDPVFRQIRINAYDFVAVERIPIPLLQDANVTFAYGGPGAVSKNPNAPGGYQGLGLNAQLADMFAARFARALEPLYATGSGVGQPLGIISAATVGVTSAGPTAITFADLENLFYSVDPAYRQNGAWMMNNATAQAIQQLVDASGTPLFNPAWGPLKILGSPVVVNNSMSGLTATSRSVAFGDFSRGALIRDVDDVRMVRLNERYADYLQAGLLCHLRTDSVLSDPQAIRILQQHA